MSIEFVVTPLNQSTPLHLRLPKAARLRNNNRNHRSNEYDIKQDGFLILEPVPPFEFDAFAPGQLVKAMSKEADAVPQYQQIDLNRLPKTILNSVLVIQS